MTSDRIKNIARVIGGSLAIANAAVLRDADLSDPWNWIVPTAFTIGIYVCGEVAGNATALFRRFKRLS